MRNDTHRPSVINPSEYEFVAFEYVRDAAQGDLGTCQFVMQERARIHAHMKETGGTYSTHEHGGNCHICGASAIYTVLFFHGPTNSYIRTGGDCAEKLEMSFGNMDAFKKAARTALEAQKGKRKAQVLLEEAGLSQAWQIRLDYLATPGFDWTAANVTDEQARAAREQYAAQREASTVCDIVNGVIKYGNLSEKQANYLRTLLDRIARKPEIEAQRKAEKEAAAPCPSGRITITGTIVKVEERESVWGITTKMLVKAAEGFMVWSTLPSGAPCERGASITFKATVKPSEDDPKFGFASRPTIAA